MSLKLDNKHKSYWAKCILIFWKPTKGLNSKSYLPLASIPVYMIHPVNVHVYTNFQLSSFRSYWELLLFTPLPLFRYTQYIQSLSMYTGTFSFLAFLGSEKSIMKIFKNGKIWKPSKGHNSKGYEPLATVLPLHFPYLRDQMWYKFCQSRTTNIKVITPIPVYMIHHCPCLYKLSAF